MKAQVAMGFGAGLLMGLLAGAVVALLFAPAKGDELRGQLSDQLAAQREKLTAGRAQDP